MSQRRKKEPHIISNGVDRIRKVELTMDGENKYEIIKRLVETKGNKQTAAMRLGCSLRHVYRLIKGYQSEGKSFFIHGNQGRKPAHTIAEEEKEKIFHLYQTQYFDCNLTHFQELLKEREKICVSVGTISTLLRKQYILSPKAKGATKKAVKKELKALQATTKSKKEAAKIHKSLLELEQAHPRRPRCAYFGEMLQMDASVNLWFGENKTHLHIAVDDATGMIVGAYFD